jgi:undecaprenyl-diphosphatase
MRIFPSDCALRAVGFNLALVLSAAFAFKERVPDWINVLLLGIIEGITEFLPISSTGHLIIAERVLGMRTDLFNTVIQTGAVLAVMLVFWNRLKQLLLHWRDREAQDYLLKLMAAFVITGAGGLLLKKLEYKLPETAGPVAWATLIGGVLILVVEGWLKGRKLEDRITWTVAITVGLAQLGAAVFPGTSRSGITILAALALGVNRPLAAEFSFLLGIPTLLAAGALQIYSAHKHGVSIEWGSVMIGFAAAAVMAFATVKWLLRYVQNHTFIVFGYYRIVLGIVILVLAPYLG